MVNKKFPIDWDLDEYGQVYIFLNDSTLTIDGDAYKRCSKFNKEFWKNE